MNAYEILNVPPTASREEIRRAYRQLARRWHPDRFKAGPEQDRATARMADINSAYHECIENLNEPSRGEADDEAGLQQVRQLVDEGRYHMARKKLMALNTRCAEWNYLFGWVLMHNCEVEKALIYLSVAAHQNPNSRKYARALQKAREMQTPAGRFSKLLNRIGML